MDKDRIIVLLRRALQTIAYRLIALTVIVALGGYFWQSISTSERTFAVAVETVNTMALKFHAFSKDIHKIALVKSDRSATEYINSLSDYSRTIEHLHSRMLKGDPQLNAGNPYRNLLQNFYYHDDARSGQQVREFLEDFRQIEVLAQDSMIVDRAGLRRLEKTAIPLLVQSLSKTGGVLESERNGQRLIFSGLLLVLLVPVLLAIVVIEKRRSKMQLFSRFRSLPANGAAQTIERFDPNLGSANLRLFSTISANPFVETLPPLKTCKPQLDSNDRDVVTINLDEAVEIRIHVRDFCNSLQKPDKNDRSRSLKMKLARLLENVLRTEKPDMTEYRMILHRLGDLLMRDSRPVNPPDSAVQKEKAKSATIYE